MPPAATYEQRRGGVLTIFFRPFLTTLEGMVAYLGFSAMQVIRVGFRNSKPQIAVHVGVWCQVHYEKGSEKDPQAPS